MSALDVKNPVCVEIIKLLGDYWMLRIISALEGGEQRYLELQRTVTDISPATLANRLKKLEEAGLITRTETSRAEVSYNLTPLGQDSVPFLAALNTFALKTAEARKTS